MYPVINHMDDLLPYIIGNKNFSINRKGDDLHGYVVVDYILNTPELFQNMWEKECRGIIFDAITGVVLSRPYHKFFNLNERPESFLKGDDGEDVLKQIDNPHVILEKLDGSMIRCFKVGDRWIWGSKAGETFLTPQIEEFVKDKPDYLSLTKAYSEYTLIWEWCSRKNRIVVDHPKDRLVWTGMRHNVTGEYRNYVHMQAIAKCFDVEIVKEKSITFYETHYCGDENFEGIVLRFDTGHMIKVKTEKYLRYHRAKDCILREKNVVSIFVNNEADDFRTLLAPDDLKRFERFENDFFYYLGNTASTVHIVLKSYMNDKVTKKEYALGLQEASKPLTRRIYFKYLEGLYVPSKTDIYYDIIEILRGKCGNQASVDQARDLFHVKWEDYINVNGVTE